MIDLSGIDADRLRPGDRAFAFIGAQAFSAAGQARHAGGRLSLAWTGDGRADLVAALAGTPVLVAESLIP